MTLASLTGLPGDFNNNGVVDAADYVVLRKGLGSIYTQNDFDVWRAHFGTVSAGIGAGGAAGYAPGASAESLSAAVPEPATLALLIFAASRIWLGRQRTVMLVSEFIHARDTPINHRFRHTFSRT